MRLYLDALHQLLDGTRYESIPEVPGAVTTRLGLACQEHLEKCFGVTPFRAYCYLCIPALLFVDSACLANHAHHGRCLQGHRVGPSGWCRCFTIRRARRWAA